MPAFKRSLSATRERAIEVFGRLEALYPDARCSLDYENPLQLLIATILAAQCTDARVNIVTKDLFRKYPNAESFMKATQEELEEAVKTCGFYRNKAKSIKKTCTDIVQKFGGEVPGTMEELLLLEGVGRKTANVLLGECFVSEGVVVDTHCGRLARRLGYTRETDPVKVERELMKVWPREMWRMYSHYFVFHGRAICMARGPRCSACPLQDLCPFPDTREGKKVAK